MQDRKPNRPRSIAPPSRDAALRPWLVLACILPWLIGCATPWRQPLAGGKTADSYAQEYLFSTDSPEHELAEEPASSPAAPVSFEQTQETSGETIQGGVHQSLSLEEILQHALEHHPLLRARQHEVEVAKAELIDAGLLPNPQLVMDTETPVAESDATDMQTRLTFTIPIGGKRRLAEDVARAEIRRARMALSREMETVLAEAVDAAMEVLYLQELTRLQDQLVSLASEAAEIEKHRFELGQITYARSVVAEVDATALHLRRLETQTALEMARLRLSRAIGQNPPRPLTVEGTLAVEPFPEVPLEAVLAAARTTRPELAVSQAGVARSQRELALARARARPDLTIGPRVQNVFGEPGDTVGARVSVDLPLFDRNQGGISQSAAQLHTDQAMLDVAELNSLGDVAAAYVQLMSIQSRLEFYARRATPLANRTEATIRDAFEKGVIESAQVSDLLQEFTRMQIDQLDLRYQHNRLRRRLELFLGKSFPELLAGASAGQTPWAAPWLGKPAPQPAELLPEPVERPLPSPRSPATAPGPAEPAPWPPDTSPEAVEPAYHPGPFGARQSPATAPPPSGLPDPAGPSAPKRLPKPPPRSSTGDSPGSGPGPPDHIPLL